MTLLGNQQESEQCKTARTVKTQKNLKKLKELESVLKPVLESAREHVVEPSLKSHMLELDGPQTCNVQEVSCSLAMAWFHCLSSIRIGGLVPDWIQYWPYHTSTSEAASPEYLGCRWSRAAQTNVRSWILFLGLEVAGGSICAPAMNFL